MRSGQIASTSALSTDWGFDRGLPVDRYYIERFLSTHSADMGGRVLEIAEDTYSRRFGGSKVERQDILSLGPHDAATIVGDLAEPGVLPASAFDCIILTQTLHLIFDLQSAVEQLHRSLRPGGVLLLTVPGITPVDRGEWKKSWHWSLTDSSLGRLLSGPFGREKIELSVQGNLYAATAFLHGAAVEELSRRKLDAIDPAYPVTVAARAIA
jgi:SAM-dependent methyltransferase